MPTKDTSWWTSRRQTGYDSYGFTPATGSNYKFRGSPLLVQRTRTGSSNPKWKQQVADHENATTAMSAVYDSVERRGANAAVSYKYLYDGVNRVTRTCTVKGDMYHGNYTGPLGGSWTSDAEKIARTRFLSQVRSTQRRFMGQVFLGELRETMRMIRSPAQGIRRQLGDYCDRIDGLAKQRGISAKRQRGLKGKQKRKYNKDLRQFVKDASGTWLENAFGLQPLLNDLEDARAALNDLMEKDRVVKVQAGGRADKLLNNTTYQTGPDVTGSFIYGLNTLVDKETYFVRYRGAVTAQAVTTYGGAAEKFGFTAADFIPSAWELLPWSFLVDYFANVGDCLEAAFTDTSQLSWSFGTTISQRVTARYWELDVNRMKSLVGSNNILYFETGNPSYYIWKRRLVTRNAGTSISPFGLFRMKFPPFDSQAGKWLNISALLAQMIQVHPQDVTRRGYRRLPRTPFNFNP